MPADHFTLSCACASLEILVVTAIGPAAIIASADRLLIMSLSFIPPPFDLPSRNNLKLQAGLLHFSGELFRQFTANICIALCISLLYCKSVRFEGGPRDLQHADRPEPGVKPPRALPP
jgi:membrane-bound metal-dependent hydrolase YbcI (DUF457 family)